MTVDEQLYLTTAVDRADGTTVYVHAAPLNRDAFDRYWKPLSRVYDDIMIERRFYSAPRVAVKMLRDIAKFIGVWEGPQGVELGLMPELRRMTNVAIPGAPQGWQLIPFSDAMRDKLIDDDDAEAIEGLLVFFSVVWHMAAKPSRKEFATTGVALCGAQTLSLSLSEFVASLPTSTATANIGEMHPEPSSPLSSIGQPMTASRTHSSRGHQTSPGGAPQNFVVAI